jgi:hypothetical protein
MELFNLYVLMVKYMKKQDNLRGGGDELFVLV